MGVGFVIDFTERFRRVSDGVAVLRLSSGDEIGVQIPAEHEIVAALATSLQRFDAFDLVCDLSAAPARRTIPTSPSSGPLLCV